MRYLILLVTTTLLLFPYAVQSQGKKGAAKAGSADALQRMQNQADRLKAQQDEINEKARQDKLKQDKEKQDKDKAAAVASNKPVTTTTVTNKNQERLPALGSSAYDDVVAAVRIPLLTAYHKEMSDVKRSVRMYENRMASARTQEERVRYSEVIQTFKEKLEKLEHNNPPYVNFDSLKKR